jgi:antitoxin HicB
MAHSANRMIDRTKKLPARFYVSSAGRNPVREWILELSSEDRHTIGKDIQKVEFGWPIRRPHCAPLGHGLWEVRSDLDSNRIAGVIFCMVDGHMILAWLHQEDTEDAATGHRPCAETQTRGDVMVKKRKARVSEETFDEFLTEQGMLGPCEERAIKEIIAEQLVEAMKAQGITKSAMAERMKTSRRQLDRLLDPARPSVTLETLRRAANAVGRTLRVELT